MEVGAVAMVAAVSMKKSAESFKNKNYRIKGELARRVQEVAKIVEERGGDLSLEERKKLCHFIADAAREWMDVYKAICNNLDFVIDRAITQREVWYRLLMVATKEVHEFLERKAQTLKRGWDETYGRIAYYFLLVLIAAGLSDEKEERPTELIMLPGEGDALTLDQFVKKCKERDVKPEDELAKHKIVIYVEKQHIAMRIRELTKFGAAILTGKGFPTKFLRRIAKKTKLLILADADKACDDIKAASKYGSKRHRKIGGEALASRYSIPEAVELGLTRQDAEKLGLFPIPETPRNKRLGFEKRYELDALSALEALGIENPYLAYVIAKLKLLGYDLRVLLPSDEEALRNALLSVLRRSVNPIIYDVAEKMAKEIVGKMGNIKEDDFTIKSEVLEQAVQLAVQLVQRGKHEAALDLISHTLLPIRENGVLWLWRGDEFIYYEKKVMSEGTFHSVRFPALAELLRKLGFHEGIMVYHLLGHEEVKELIHKIFGKGHLSWPWARSIFYKLKQLGLAEEGNRYIIELEYRNMALIVTLRDIYNNLLKEYLEPWFNEVKLPPPLSAEKTKDRYLVVGKQHIKEENEESYFSRW